MEKNKKIVVIGGGTGTFVVLSGLKKYEVDLSAIVTVADSGGSTGRLRDEFGFLPVGDLRQGLAALAKDNHQGWIRKLLLYRFSKGEGLKGHNLGNLLLTALQDLTGSTAKAVEIASSIFRLYGHIYPVTTANIQVKIYYEDGSVEVGEHVLDESKHEGVRITNIKTVPRAKIYKKSKEAIEEADLIIIGPGDLYGSIMPNLIVDGVKLAMKKTKAKIVYIGNLMTRYSQTHNMSLSDHLRVVESAMGKAADAVIINEQPIPLRMLNSYKKQHEFPVVDDLGRDKRAIRRKLIRTSRVDKQAGDELVRSYLRHDPYKLAKTLLDLI